MKLIYGSEADCCDECNADNLPLVEIGSDKHPSKLCHRCMEKALITLIELDD